MSDATGSGGRFFARVLREEIVGKSAVLFFSTVAANLISLLGYFLLTRVYSMEVIGEFFAVIAIASIVSVFIHFGLAQAIPLMDEADVKTGVTLLSCVSLFVMFSGLVSLIFNSYLFLVLVAAGVLSLSALFEIVLIRGGRVKPLAFIRSSIPFVSFTVTLICGLTFKMDAWLLTGSFVSGMTVVVIGSFWYVAYPLWVKPDREKARALVSCYSRFPRFIGPGLFFNTAAFNLPSAVGLHFFGGVTIAAYNLAYKFVYAPMSMLGTAIGQAYISKMSKEYRVDNSLAMSIKLDVVLFVLATVVSSLIYLVFPWVARLLFVDSHMEISSYAIALIPLVFSMLSVAPLTNLFQFTNNQRKILVIQFFTFLSAVLAFSIAIIKDDFLLGVMIFSILALIRYAWVYYEVLQVRKSEC